MKVSLYTIFRFMFVWCWKIFVGDCWINFLKDQMDLTVVGDFLIKMMKKEVDEYPKYVYHINSKREPTDYSLLPSHSLVRGIVQYCSTQVRNLCFNLFSYTSVYFPVFNFRWFYKNVTVFVNLSAMIHCLVPCWYQQL